LEKLGTEVLSDNREKWVVPRASLRLGGKNVRSGVPTNLTRRWWVVEGRSARICGQAAGFD